jgi:DNA polymerase-1
VLVFKDTLAGSPIRFDFVQYEGDYSQVQTFVMRHKYLAIDTESTGINCYQRDWKLRAVQIGDADVSYVITFEHRELIQWIIEQDVTWIGHNGPHDWRCIDQYLGYETGNYCAGDTYVPSHHDDARNQMEGGIGHGLKELAIHHVAHDAGKWEVDLKQEFKKIEIPVEGEYYKSGPRKGQQRVRKAKFSEGWKLIPIDNPAYIAYAGADPILTYRLWAHYQPLVKRLHKLYRFDLAVDRACDRLQRRAMRLDVDYTQRLSRAYERAAQRAERLAAEYGCYNLNSTAQVAETLVRLGVRLTARTPTGKLQVNDKILRKVVAESIYPKAVRFAQAVLTAKQVRKRQAAYADAFIEEMDENCRVHPSINSLAARTARMSVSNPPLQQLPTKDREAELLDG